MQIEQINWSNERHEIKDKNAYVIWNCKKFVIYVANDWT